MSVKKLFNKDDELRTILASADIKTIGNEVESAEYIKSFLEDKDRFVPHIDFSSASNFAKFGSAEQYYEDAIKRVYQTYPYDGSLREKLDWHNSSSYFENYIFEKKYPRTTGYINFSPAGWGSLADGTAITNGYGSPTTQEYILLKGGPHPSIRPKGKNITDSTGNYKDGFSSTFKASQTIDSNLRIDGAKGNTVEFWLKKTAFTTSKTEKEVIFDLYNANAGYTEAGYGRMCIELDGGGATAKDVLRADAWAYNDSFTANVPTNAGGTGTTVTVIVKNGLAATPGTNEIHWTGVGSDATRQANLALAINGTSNTAKVKYGSGITDGATEGIKGLTAAVGSNYYVSLTAADTGTAGNEIAIADGTGTTIVIEGQLSSGKLAGGKDSPFLVTYMSGNVGFASASIGSSITTSSLADETWHHYAFTFANSGSNLQAKLYVDGKCNNTIIGSTANLAHGQSTATLSYLSGAMVATVGALATAPSASDSGPAIGWGKFSGSLDEFRFWKTKRTPQDIGRYWISHVGGGNNTDAGNRDLGVYYKFNEGIIGNSSVDSSVLDYAGRISNGTWTGYTSDSRNTGSAIVSSSATSVKSEFEDPILYPTHTRVKSLYNSLTKEGKEYDYRNNSSLYHSFPSWITEEDTDKTLKKLSQTVSTYLDTVFLQTQELPKIKNVNYVSGAYKPYPFTNRLLESKGFIAPDIFPDAEVIEYFLNRGETELFKEKLYNIKNRIYQNIYNNLSYIYKSKGTEKAFRNLIRCFGVDHELLKFNLYGDNVTYGFENDFSSVTVKKKAVNFNHPNNHEATVYQHTASANANSISYVSGAINTATSSIPITIETEAIFPKQYPLSSRYYKEFSNLTSSLFGVHTAVPDQQQNLTWYDNDVANFQVHAIRKTNSEYIDQGSGFTNRDAYFALTSTDGSVIPTLTSSVYHNVYDNNKWNFAVRVRPTNYPFAGSTTNSFTSDTTFHVEFYGVNSHADIVTNEFSLTGTITKNQGAQFMTSSKRLYVGAHRTNFTGAAVQLSNVKVASTRWWTSYLDDKTIKAHARDPRNFGALHPNRSAYLFEDKSLPADIPQINTLILNWDFETVSSSNSGNTGYDYYGGSSRNASFGVDDASSGSLVSNTFESSTGNYGWLGEIIKRQHTGKGDFFTPDSTNVISREYINAAKQNSPENLQSSDTVNILSRDDEVFTRDTRPTTHFFAIEKSMGQVISQEMLDFFATIVDFNNLIGEPVNRYRQDYKDLAKLRQFFFERVQNIPDVEKFLDYYKWLDSGLSKMILKLMPASARHAKKIRNIIESHALERNKYCAKFITLAQRSPAEIGAASGEKPTSGVPFVDPGRTLDALTTPGIPDLVNKNILPTIKMSTNLDGAGVLWDRINLERGTSTDVNTNRETFRKVVQTSVNRGRKRPVSIGVDRNSSPEILSGWNTDKNKKVDAHKPVVNFSSDQDNMQITSADVESEGDYIAYLRNQSAPDRKFKFSYKTSGPLLSGHYGHHTIPFSLYRTATSTGYVALITNGFSASVDITNLHHDTYGATGEIAIQGPFTEKFVGGNQHRHHWSHFKLDTPTTRPEAWKIALGSSTITFSKPDSSAKPRAQYTRDQIAKRPINIRNIRQTTGSTADGLYTNIGNFTKDYDIVQTSGRGTNNRYFTENEGISVNWEASQKPDSFALPFFGISNFTTINRALSGTNSFVFVERFSAPGGPETMCESFLDIESGEKSVYNALPYRNLAVRIPLNEMLTNHANQFGFYSDTQFSSSWRDAIDNGLKAGGSYPGRNTTVSSANYLGTASFHEVNRNTKKVIKYSNEFSMAKGTVHTASVHDNWFIQHPIPQSDMQYQWITASAANSIIGYQQKDHANAGQASTDITFMSQSHVENTSGLKVDYANTNQIVIDPLIVYSNLLSASNNTYGNTIVGTVSDANILNALLLNRNGPYEHPSWKQIRAGEHQVARYQKNNNLLSIIKTESDRSLLHFTESVVTTRYKPMKHTLIPQGTTNAAVLKHTYANNLVTFANRDLVAKLNTTILGGDQIYDDLRKLYLNNFMPAISPKFIEFSYEEVIWPREVNMFLNKTRTREKFRADWWRDKRVDRKGVFQSSIGKFQGNIDLYARWNYEGQVGLIAAAPQTPSSSYDGMSPWPLDASTDWLTKNPGIVTAKVTASAHTSGELQAKYAIWHGGGEGGKVAEFSSQFSPTNCQNCLGKYIVPSPTYAYPHWAVQDSGQLVSGGTLWEAGTQAGKNPFYDSYDDFASDLRAAGKDYSLIPEFRISEHMKHYIDTKQGNFFTDPANLLTLTGSTVSTSNEDSFFKIYAHADFLKHFDLVKNQHKGFADPIEIKLKCKALMKFLPYEGFYPVQRTMELVKLFEEAYGGNVSRIYTDPGATVSHMLNSNPRTFYQPFFSPGILYNTIKAGYAVDYPIHLDLFANGGVQGAKGSPDNNSNFRTDMSSSANVRRARIAKDFQYRVPFEALVNPEEYVTGKYIVDSIPHPSAAIASVVRFNGQSSTERYKLAMHNFLAESINFFLEDGELTTLKSAQDTDQNFYFFEEEKPYMMDVRLYQSAPSGTLGSETTEVNDFAGVYPFNSDTLTQTGGRFFMYDNPGAFGPLVDSSFVFSSSLGKSANESDFSTITSHGYQTATGSAHNPFTPPSKDGLARVRLSFTPYNGPGRYTIPEIVTHLTATYARYRGIQEVAGHCTTPTPIAAAGVQYKPNSGTPGTEAHQLFGNILQNPNLNWASPIMGPSGSFRTASIDYNHSMHVSSSLNLFQIENVQGKTIDSEGAVATDVGGFDKGARWVIQPKFETPVLNFADCDVTMPQYATASVNTGMWHQYGQLPSGGIGIYLEISEPKNHALLGDLYNNVRNSSGVNNQSDPRLIPHPWDPIKTGSLAAKCGFLQSSAGTSKKKIGRPRKDNEMSFKEAIVLVPFTKNINKRTSAIATKFFNINKHTINKAIKAVDSGTPQTESGVSNSIYNMVSAMNEYVIPPKFNFILQMKKGMKGTKPFAMYFFEFEHELSQKDITDMWQNLPPEIGRSFKEAEATISHKLLKSELMSDIPDSELHWIVFKVKKKAKQNYYAQTASTLDDILFKFNLEDTSGTPDYSFNWPYDFCSLVELAKIEAEVVFESKETQVKKAKAIKAKLAAKAADDASHAEELAAASEAEEKEKEKEDIEVETTTDFGASGPGAGDLFN